MLKQIIKFFQIPSLEHFTEKENINQLMGYIARLLLAVLIIGVVIEFILKLSSSRQFILICMICTIPSEKKSYQYSKIFTPYRILLFNCLGCP